jgi:hypothetical protein
MKALTQKHFGVINRLGTGEWRRWERYRRMPGSQELMRFIRSTFRSVWSLELLCFLMKHADRDWTRDELVAALRASDLIVRESLAALAAAGLVVVHADGAVRYQPAGPSLAASAEAAEQLYARSPDAVRRAIVSAASGDIAAFADAFRLRKD